MALLQNNPANLGRFFKSEPSLAMCKFYRMFWILFYIVLFALKDSLPEKFGRDAATLAEMIESNDFDAGSYGAMAAIYSHVPSALLPFLPLVVCIPSLWIILRYVRSYPVMMIMPVLLLPYMVMNFIYPSKETFVGVMMIGIYWISQSKLSTLRTFIILLVLYAAYAAFIRSYYFLIAAFFLAIMVARQIPAAFTVLGIMLGLTAMAFLPESVFIAIQGSRDDNSLIMSKLSHEVRTYFFNPMPPDNLLAFLVNMSWGILVMFIPFLIAQSFNEVLMMVNVFFYTGTVLAMLRYKRGGAQLPALLFIGHILTQAQFEPDLGSYVRHFSCTLVMLSPAIYYMFRSKSAKELMAEAMGEANAASAHAALASTSATTAR